jgi:hypothetical protein
MEILETAARLGRWDNLENKYWNAKGRLTRVGQAKLLICLARVAPLHGHHLSHGCVSTRIWHPREFDGFEVDCIRGTLGEPSLPKEPRLLGDYHLVFSFV